MTIASAKSNDDAVAAFVWRKLEIDRMLAALTQLSADHFGVSPDALHWGDVGDLGMMRDKLAEICDAFGLPAGAGQEPSAAPG